MVGLKLNTYGLEVGAVPASPHALDDQFVIHIFDVEISSLSIIKIKHTKKTNKQHDHFFFVETNN